VVVEKHITMPRKNRGIFVLYSCFFFRFTISDRLKLCLLSDPHAVAMCFMGETLQKSRQNAPDFNREMNGDLLFFSGYAET